MVEVAIVVKSTDLVISNQVLTKNTSLKELALARNRFTHTHEYSVEFRP